jgi:hypothetical protein
VWECAVSCSAARPGSPPQRCRAAWKTEPLRDAAWKSYSNRWRNRWAETCAFCRQFAQSSPRGIGRWGGGAPMRDRGAYQSRARRRLGGRAMAARRVGHGVPVAGARGRQKAADRWRRSWLICGYLCLVWFCRFALVQGSGWAPGVNIVPLYPAQQAGRKNLENRKNPVRWKVLPDSSLAAGLPNHLLLDSPLTSGREVRRIV